MVRRFHFKWGSQGRLPIGIKMERQQRSEPCRIPGEEHYRQRSESGQKLGKDSSVCGMKGGRGRIRGYSSKWGPVNAGSCRSL